MSDFTVTMSRITPENGTWTKSVVIPDMAESQVQLAGALGIDELMKQCADDPDLPATFSVAAVDYWRTCRRQGNMQMYEILSELEGRWGLTFTTVPTENATASEPSKPSEKVKKAAAPKQPRELPDLRSMMAERLALLQDQEKSLAAEYKRINTEREQVREDIRQTSDVLLMLGTPKKKGRKVADAEA